MKSLISLTALALVTTLTGCGGDPTDAGSDVAQLPTKTASIGSVTAQSSLEPSISTVQPASTLDTQFRGKWVCTVDNGNSKMLRLEFAGNTLREVVSEITMHLSYGTGIELEGQLVDYRDPSSGQLIHARKMKQVKKIASASIFSEKGNGGAGAGVEFSLNPNDTLTISDYSSMHGTDEVGQVVPMTCLRDRA